MYRPDSYDKQVEAFLKGMQSLEYGVSAVQIALCIAAAIFLWNGSKGFRRQDNTVNWEDPDDRNTAISAQLGFLYLTIGVMILVFAIIILPQFVPDISFLDNPNR